MNNVVIFGGSGHTKVLIDIIQKEGKYNLLGLIDNKLPIKSKILGYDVLGSESSLGMITKENNVYGGVIGIGDNSVRANVRDKILKICPNFKFVNCIHPNSVIGKDVVIGEGNVVMAGAIINPSSTLKNHCIVNTNSSLDHDCVMSNFSSLAPNSTIGGNVTIGEFSVIGIGSNVLQGIKIGYNCIVGSGSLVCKDTTDNSVFYGIPSKYIRRHNLGDRYL